MKRFKTSKYFVLVILPIMFFLTTTSVLAISATNGAERRAEVREEVKNRLTDARLKSCQAKEESIKNRLSHLNQLATNMQEKFDAIAERVKEYYTTKVVPSGKTVANYDTLVANVATKKTQVQTALTKAQDDVAGFSCDGEDPKGHLTTFRLDMQAVKGALKEYRTSIKNLIVAIRSVTGETKKASPTPTATP